MLKEGSHELEEEYVSMTLDNCNEKLYKCTKCNIKMAKDIFHDIIFYYIYSDGTTTNVYKSCEEHIMLGIMK